MLSEKRIMVTDGAGFWGGHLVQKLSIACPETEAFGLRNPDQNIPLMECVRSVMDASNSTALFRMA